MTADLPEAALRTTRPVASTARYAFILPACDEEDCIARVLEEFQKTFPAGGDYLYTVGINGSTDGTARMAHEAGALIGETASRGYGFGCQAAIRVAEESSDRLAGFIFVAADGANDPGDVFKLVCAHQAGVEMVLGCRTTSKQNWTARSFHYVLANRFFGLLVGGLTGVFFKDLGPLRLIDRSLFHRLKLREMTYGWTIEAQVRAALLGAKIEEMPVRERPRIAGEQKVSHVSWRQTLRVGLHIIGAAFRARFGSGYDRE